MRISALLGTTILASGLLLGQTSLPAYAGLGDLSAVLIAAGTNPGEFAVIEDGPNNFQIVTFFATGADPATATPISGPFESSTLNTGSTASPQPGEAGAYNAPENIAATVDDGISTLFPTPGVHHDPVGFERFVSLIRGLGEAIADEGIDRIAREVDEAFSGKPTPSIDEVIAAKRGAEEALEKLADFLT